MQIQNNLPALNAFLLYRTTTFSTHAGHDSDDENNRTKRRAKSYIRLEPVEPLRHEYTYCDAWPLSGDVQDGRPVVYGGEQLSSAFPVTIKLNHICHVAYETIAESTVREIEILRHLSQPQNASNRVVQYIDSFRCKRHVYLVMSPAAGADLFTLLMPPDSTGCIDFHPDRIIMSRQLIEGLDFLHQHDIAHFDIKCENILYCVVSKHLTIIDFGGSRMLPQDGTVLWHSFGTRATKAPELCDPRNHPPTIAARPVDIWAAGIMLVILNTAFGLQRVYCASMSFPFASQRVLPFSDGSEAVAEKLRIWSMSNECADICGSILSVNPADRPTTAQVMDSPWWHSTDALDFTSEDA